MTAAGAEADSNAIYDVAEDYGWTKAELSVLYLFILPPGDSMRPP